MRLYSSYGLLGDSVKQVQLVHYPFVESSWFLFVCLIYFLSQNKVTPPTCIRSISFVFQEELWEKLRHSKLASIFPAWLVDCCLVGHGGRAGGAHGAGNRHSVLRGWRDPWSHSLFKGTLTREKLSLVFFLIKTRPQPVLGIRSGLDRIWIRPQRTDRIRNRSKTRSGSGPNPDPSLKMYPPIYSIYIMYSKNFHIFTWCIAKTFTYRTVVFIMTVFQKIG